MSESGFLFFVVVSIEGIFSSSVTHSFCACMLICVGKLCWVVMSFYIVTAFVTGKSIREVEKMNLRKNGMHHWIFWEKLLEHLAVFYY